MFEMNGNDTAKPDSATRKALFTEERLEGFRAIYGAVCYGIAGWAENLRAEGFCNRPAHRPVHGAFGDGTSGAQTNVRCKSCRDFHGDRLTLRRGRNLAIPQAPMAEDTLHAICLIKE